MGKPKLDISALLDEVAHVPDLSTADDCAVWCWESYLKAKDQTDHLRKSLFAKAMSRGGSSNELYGEAVSLFQSKDGGLAHRIIFNAYQSFFGTVALGKVEQKTNPYTNKRDADCFWVFPALVLAASVTTIPQERKDDTWPGESERLWHHREEWKPRTTEFWGIFFSGGKNSNGEPASLKTTRNIQRSKQAMMPGAGSTIVAIQDIDAHAALLSSLIGRALRKARRS